MKAVHQVLRGLRRVDGRALSTSSCTFAIKPNPQLVACVIWDMFLSQDGPRLIPRLKGFDAVGNAIVRGVRRYVDTPRDPDLKWGEKKTKTQDWIGVLQRPLTLVLVALAVGSVEGRFVVRAWYRRETIVPPG